MRGGGRPWSLSWKLVETLIALAFLGSPYILSGEPTVPRPILCLPQLIALSGLDACPERRPNYKDGAASSFDVPECHCSEEICSRSSRNPSQTAVQHL